jgi:hypothetical protein
MTGIERIAAERKRQIEKEGFTAEHDDRWKHQELASAALCYCMLPPKMEYVLDGSVEHCIPEDWLFHPSLWKPTPDNRIRELEKAGALVAAEIDRLQRLKNKKDDLHD